MALTVGAHCDCVTDANGIEDQANKILFFASILDMFCQLELHDMSYDV
jgi:hypothetical protein